MSHAISQSIPCLGTSKPYYTEEKQRTSSLFDMKDKIVGAVGAFFAVVALILLPSLPAVGGACLIASGLALVYVALRKAIEAIWPSSTLEKLEKLEAAKELAVGIEISPTLQKELQEIIPKIDAIEQDERIASVHYNCNKTATFTLKTAPDLQFRISPASSRHFNEFELAKRYENAIYAKEICLSENYDSLSVPSIKQIKLNVNGLPRPVLVEKVIQEEAPSENLNRAVRQMVQFLLKIGGNVDLCLDPISFIPVEGNKLALQNLYFLTSNPHPEVTTREFLEVESIIGKKNSLLLSLDREDLIDIALNELERLRPIDLLCARYGNEERAKATRHKEIENAKQWRMQQVENPAQIDVQPEPIAPPNILGVVPEDLELDLDLKDYAIIKREGLFSDGVCRVITLGEAAQAILNLINQKLEENPENPEIQLTPQDLLIGEELPLSTWGDHYQYNMLQGLGYREWPNPDQEPPYWMALVLQSLQNKGLIENFDQQRRNTLRVNLAALPPGEE